MQHPHAVIRDEEPEAGFTLIELMIVVLIIAVLIAVMIPTFVGAKHRAQDRATQTSLHNGFTAAKVIFSDHGDYTEATAAALGAVEPSLTFVTAGLVSSGPNAVSVDPVSSSYIVMAGQSNSGACFFMADDASAAGVGVRYAKVTGAACSASGAPAPGNPAWGTTW